MRVSGIAAGHPRLMRPYPQLSSPALSPSELPFSPSPSPPSSSSSRAMAQPAPRPSPSHLAPIPRARASSALSSTFAVLPQVRPSPTLTGIDPAPAGRHWKPSRGASLPPPIRRPWLPGEHLHPSSSLLAMAPPCCAVPSSELW
ncbi:hypothetical protein PVAP13_9NG154373 [Panicum virgatum]|uniref:Uncharacterized protein n=1 Tax=Panicum virgatum TaxID=38727 RepID=A0A8T0MFB3_PANVG|nr:hypothetical protein PVAP13_9NG154373 [Panicum virgatum]